MGGVKRSFLNRLLITYTILVCSLIMLIFSGFVISLQKSHAQKITDMDNETLAGYAEAFDRTIDGMRQFAGNLKNIGSLNLFAYSSKEKYYWRMADLYNDLKQANALLSKMPYNILVHKQNDDTVITNTGSSKIHRFLDSFQMTLNEYQQMVQHLGDGRINQERIIITDTDLIYVTQKDLIDTKMIFVLYSSFQNLGLEQDALLPISFCTDDPRILDRRTENAAPAFTETAEQLGSAEVQELKADGKAYQGLTSAYYDVVFYYPSADVIMTGEIWRQILGLLLVSVLVCAVACCMVAVFSVRLYRPIERIVNTLLSTGDPGVSGESKNELDYMTRRVAQIRQENCSLAALLDDSSRLLREKVIGDILRGTEKAETLPGLLKRCGLGWVEGPCAAVLFDFSELQGEHCHGEEKITDQVMDMLDEQLGKAYVLQRAVPSGLGESVCYILKDAQPDALKRQLHEIILVIDTAFQIPLHAFMAPAASGVRDLYAAYLLLSRLSENYRKLPIKNVYDTADLALLENESAAYSLSLELRLVQAVVQNSRAEAASLLRRVYTEYIAPAFSEKQPREAMIFALAQTLRRAAQQAGVELCGDAEELLRRSKAPEALYQTLEARFQEIMESTASAVQRKETALREELETYLQENLSRDVSLLDLADCFHLSPNYMSALFKSATGSNFKDYLSRLRCERAKEILDAQPDIKLAQLGEQVGILNVNTLIRVFKKYTGVSPGQYQRGRQAEPAAKLGEN